MIILIGTTGYPKVLIKVKNRYFYYHVDDTYKPDHASSNSFFNVRPPILHVPNSNFQAVYRAVHVLPHHVGLPRWPATGRRQTVQLREVGFWDWFSPIAELLNSLQTVVKALTVVSEETYYFYTS